MALSKGTWSIRSRGGLDKRHGLAVSRKKNMVVECRSGESEWRHTALTE